MLSLSKNQFYETVEKLEKLGFSGQGYDGIQMTRNEIEEHLGLKGQLDPYDHGENGENEYGGTDIYIYMEDEEDEYNGWLPSISIEILEDMVHDICFNLD